MRIKRFILFALLVSWIIPNWFGLKAQDNLEIDDLIFEYGVIGWRNVRYNINLDTAEYYLSEALRLQYSTPEYEIDDRVARNHINLATVYKRIYNNNKALHHLTKAEEILKQTDPESFLFGPIYNNKGNIIKSNSDIFRTRQYYEYALDFLIKTGNKNTNDFLGVYTNYLSVLFELHEYDLAIRLLSDIDIENLDLSPHLSFDFHLMKAASFFMFEKYDEAIANYNLAKQLLSLDDLKQDYYRVARYYIEIITFYIEIDEYGKSYDAISEAQLFIQSLGKYSQKLRTTYYSTFQYLYAYTLYLEEKYDNSLRVINTVVDDLVNFFKEQSMTAINAQIRNENSSLLPELHTLKSRLLLDIFRKDDSKEILQEAFYAYDLSIEIFNSTKLAIQNEDSKFFATAAIQDVYNEAIYVGKLLYEMTGETEYLEKAFEFTESSKSFALFSEIKDVEAMEFSDLPTDIRENEQRLIGQIQGYEEMLYDEQLEEEPDSVKVAFFKDKLFHLNDDYNDLMQEIEVNNAKYFEFKYNPKFVSLEQVQEQLPYRDALIEYVLTDTMLITYVVDKKGINVFSQVIGPEFAGECLEYYRLAHTQNFSNGVHENYKRFVTLGQKFYSILVEPCLKFTDRKNFTIVPDGAITYLSFEGFITGEADTEYINYLTLPYLIRDYSVGYSHSSTLLFSERLKTKSPENKVLAFAPRYHNPLNYNDTAYFRQVVSEKELLLPLGGIIKEVQSIHETVPSKIFMNEKATEANFKKHAPDYNVLHLAMHTIMKDDNPLHSLLAFTNVEDADTTEDNRLYAYEVYNLKLNAQMAVLSSCSSGFGKMQKGEGMMSLARGFFYAGCPSIVMTLWQVADQSSSMLMTSFYKYLKKGKSKQEAMRLAKIDYLDEADDLTSNPYFWSGFVVVGDSSPIYRKSGMVYWIGIVALFIGILFFFQYRKS